jgi:hypothetical protein
MALSKILGILKGPITVIFLSPEVVDRCCLKVKEVYFYSSN